MKKKHGDNIARIPSKEDLLTILAKQNRPLRLDAMLKVLGLRKRARTEMENILNSLASENRLARLPGGAWAVPGILKEVTGIFRSLPSGAGIVRPDIANGDKGKDIFIPPAHTGGAWPGDKVRVLLFPGGGEGKICEIIERKDKNIAAVVIKNKKGMLFCHPANAEMPVNFSVRANNGQNGEIKTGDVVELHPEKQIASDLWAASLVKVYGDEATELAQECIVKLKHGVPSKFPPLALEQTSALPDEPDEKDVKEREDLRDLPFVTIDGADARDFDDAIQVQKRHDGWLLRVAIADVSHYVVPDGRSGSLDREACSRGNSWYFPRSVEPMLPQALSNGLCSLRPGCDRLAVLAEIPYSRDGEPGQPRFNLIIMRSAARLTYDEAGEFFNVLKEGKTDCEYITHIKDNSITTMLADAFDLYQKISARREQRGSLDFDLPEPSYKFDDAGHLLRIGIAPRNDAHMLIEDFMIAANEAVARHLEKTGLPFLYRGHPAPEQIKLAALYENLKSAGLEKLPANLFVNGQPNPHALKEILDIAKNHPQEFAVNRMCLRSMQQARYMPENVGHFGLASACYCHFTSPIRRYADLLTHRALKKSLGFVETLPDKEKLWQIGEELNNRERTAMECEREMSRRLGCLLLEKHIGEDIGGVISGVTNFGLFVEFDGMPVEGLIRIADLGDDWFELDERAQRLKGLRSGVSLRLGQAVEARIAGVDLEKMEIRLELTKEILPQRKAGRRKHSSSRQKRDAAITNAAAKKIHKSKAVKPAKKSAHGHARKRRSR